MNTNCLEGVRCPQCGNQDEFRIEVVAVCKVTDDSAEITGDLEWTDDSWCYCPKCDNEGILGKFRDQDDKQMRLAVPCSICGRTPEEHDDEECRKEYED